MNRLDRIKAALGQLNFQPRTEVVPIIHPHINRSVLTDVMDCLQFICFPECCSMPPSLRSVSGDRASEMEVVLGHVSDILTNQIYFAFILHGDEGAVADTDTFAPLKTSQRTMLDWDAPQSSIDLRSSPMYQDDPIAVEATPAAGASAGDAAGDSAPASRLQRYQNDLEQHHRKQEKQRRQLTRPPIINAGFLQLCKSKADAIVTKFLIERLPHVRWLLHTDVEAIFKGDVAATSPSEIVLCYPGLRCLLHQRVAHQLYLLGVPTNFTRMLTEIAHGVTGIDIHPNTSIGHHFFMDHGTGIVIGATAIIGNHVSVYQGVTLGARSFPVDKETGEKILDLPRHPVLEDNVTVYANAVVLGRVTIGKNSTIGGNCWIVRNVPPNSSIVQKFGYVLKPNEKMFLNTEGIDRAADNGSFI